MSQPQVSRAKFDIVEASISDHLEALSSGTVTSVGLVISYLLRIARYDVRDGLNAFTVFNTSLFNEAQASDAWRVSGKSPRLLEGIPYTLKDSYKYSGLTVTNGSPALEGMMSNTDSGIAAKLRAAGAVLIGKTNMPPMACGGMQRGLYGRAENPYNRNYLTAAYSSGSSNGAATATAASMAVFGIGSETVSSGRSPASNNALVVYTPSKGLLSCRGLWPLYVTCDVPTPITRTVEDMLALLNVLVDDHPDADTEGDFWRTQTHINLPVPSKPNYSALANPNALKGKRIGVPKMYIGQSDSHPNAKHPVVNPAIISLWHRARKDLESLGAEVILTDFPLVTHYEDDSASGLANNILGAPDHWTSAERGMVIAKSWEDFLKPTMDPNLQSLADIDTTMFFPKPANYVPDTFLEVKNLIDYASLPSLAAKYADTPIHDLPGMKQALLALEAQRKRDFEDWLDENRLDFVVFPAQGDVGRSDLEFNLSSAEHALQNGVRYSNGNRAIRHLGVPTVSVPMGLMEGSGMPVNLTFAGKAYEDAMLLGCAYAYEWGSRRRVAPGSTPGLESDVVGYDAGKTAMGSGKRVLNVTVDIRVSKAPVGGGQELDQRYQQDQTQTETRTQNQQAALSIHASGAITTIATSSTSSALPPSSDLEVQVYLDGTPINPNLITISTSASTSAPAPTTIYDFTATYAPNNAERLDWSLTPMPPRPVMVLVVVRDGEGAVGGEVVWAEIEGGS